MSTNQTPPAWAMQAAEEIWMNCVVSDDVMFKTSKAAEVISQYAPDAEALADVLEWLVAINARHERGTNWTTCMLQARDVLTQYRARFPKSQETR